MPLTGMIARGEGCGGKSGLGAILGQRFFFSTTGHGSCHCERCGGDRAYRRLSGRRWMTSLLVPVLPLGKAPEHLQCTVCGTRYRLDLLGAAHDCPDAGGAAGWHAGRGGGDAPRGRPPSASARHRAVEVIREAGLMGYDDAALEADLARAVPAGPGIAGPAERACRPAGRPGEVVVPCRCSADRAGGRPAEPAAAAGGAPDRCAARHRGRPCPRRHHDDRAGRPVRLNGRGRPETRPRHPLP